MILGNLLLALAWAALNGQFTLASLITGAVLGRIVLIALAKGGVLPSAEVGRIERVISLLGYLIWQIVVANLRVARDVISLQPRMRPGVIRLPLEVSTDEEIMLLAAMINITPGSVALDVSDDRRAMFVHVLDMNTPDEARREIKEGFERRILDLRSTVQGGINAA
ncbi:MAG TPA: Na+/H+ antiporter subunit E [Bryobacteraceae bacterium]|nr:Na+/H+ antiporter subunit E [Bryobacteraceae bacterium]